MWSEVDKQFGLRLLRWDVENAGVQGIDVIHVSSSRCQPRTSQSRNHLNVFQTVCRYWTCPYVLTKANMAAVTFVSLSLYLCESRFFFNWR